MINVLINRLNYLLKIDREAMTRLISQRIGVTGSPLIEPECPAIVGPNDQGVMVFGALGLINGLHGDPEFDIAVYYGTDGLITHFDLSKMTCFNYNG